MRWMLPKPVLQAINALEQAGFAAYAVGGCVRDQVLGMTPNDYDVCTSAKPRDMERIFAKERTIETGIRHGTLTVMIDGMAMEITTFRQDGEYTDGRHPESVHFTGDVTDDLSRRDFTINAMAYSPIRGFIDPFGGRKDCEKGIIRCVGEAEARFREDALRILRALRFSARLGFPIEEKTAAAIHLQKDDLHRISRERVAAEMNGWLLGDHAHETLNDFADAAASALMHPSFSALIAGGAWPKTLERLSRMPADLPLRWAALLRETGDENARRILTQLKQPGKLIKETGALITLQSDESMPMQERWMRSALLTGGDTEEAALWLKKALILAQEHEKQEEIDALMRQNACVTVKQLAVHGEDAAAAGLKGREIGDALNRLLVRVVRGQTPNERSALLEALKNA